MDARHFLGLEATDDPLRWRLPVTPAVCTPGRFLYGGCGLAAGIVALEEASGRPTVWASAQYLAYAPTGTVLEWEVVLAASGRNTTQGRAIGRRDNEEVLTVNAALGHSDQELAGTWVDMPGVPDPEDCPVQQIPPMFADTVLVRVEHRLASGRMMGDLDGTPGEARSAAWTRVPGHLEPSAATLAIIGDYVSGGVSQPLGVRTMGRSLDNSLRVVRLVPTEWILCDIHIHALSHGFGHGMAHLWAQDGTLLGTASQSISVRPWPGDAAVLAGAALSGTALSGTALSGTTPAGPAPTTTTHEGER